MDRIAGALFRGSQPAETLQAQLAHIARVASAAQAPALFALCAEQVAAGRHAQLAADTVVALTARHAAAAFEAATFADGDAGSLLGKLLLPPAPRQLLVLPPGAASAEHSGDDAALHNSGARARWAIAAALLGAVARGAGAASAPGVVRLVQRCLQSVAASLAAAPDTVPPIAAVLGALPQAMPVALQASVATAGLGWLATAPAVPLPLAAEGGTPHTRAVVRAVMLSWATPAARAATRAAAAPAAGGACVAVEGLDEHRVSEGLRFVLLALCSAGQDGRAMQGLGVLLQSLGSGFAPLLALHAHGGGAKPLCLCICRMSNWPMTEALGEWLHACLQALGAARPHAVELALASDGHGGLVQPAFALAAQLLEPARWRGAHKALERLLLGHRGSQRGSQRRAFHQLLPALLQIAEKAGPELAESLSWMLTCLISLHPGYPELYSPARAALQKLPMPQALAAAQGDATSPAAQSAIIAQLSTFTWPAEAEMAAAAQQQQQQQQQHESVPGVTISDAMVAHRQGGGAGVGLENLGNTYVPHYATGSATSLRLANCSRAHPSPHSSAQLLHEQRPAGFAAQHVRPMRLALVAFPLLTAHAFWRSHSRLPPSPLPPVAPLRASCSWGTRVPRAPLPHPPCLPRRCRRCGRSCGSCLRAWSAGAAPPSRRALFEGCCRLCSARARSKTHRNSRSSCLTRLGRRPQQAGRRRQRSDLRQPRLAIRKRPSRSRRPLMPCLVAGSAARCDANTPAVARCPRAWSHSWI